MTKKERTIKAIETLIEFYSEHDGKTSECPLCHIHNNCRYYNSCVGCPSANGLGDEGCGHFASFNWGDTVGAKRKAFWVKYLPIIKKWPENRFTRRGWKYSEEISRED